MPNETVMLASDEWILFLDLERVLVSMMEYIGIVCLLLVGMNPFGTFHEKYLFLTA